MYFFFRAAASSLFCFIIFFFFDIFSNPEPRMYATYFDIEKIASLSSAILKRAPYPILYLIKIIN
ncbi:hypothetical protein LEP1GSC171_0605 [Leptospira santarosai str. HAI1380]|nr:hypothetical protein LEP1GSC171_0605 [Leptospira santarosai str. HAI1380]